MGARDHPTRRDLAAVFADDVLQSIGDSGRVCPMVAGVSQLQVRRKISRLIVRTPAEEIEIHGPQRLLSAVFDLCDGTRTLREVTSSSRGMRLGKEFSDFLQFLLDEGALIDGNMACAEAARYAHQFNPVGMVAPTRTTGQIARRFSWREGNEADQNSFPTFDVPTAPLQDLFSHRVTQYTFADRTPSDTALHALLWSLAGIVRCTHPRTQALMPQRTLGSAGGMHLLEIYVALLRPTPLHSVGMYRVHYLGEASISFERLEGDVRSVPLAFGKPWELTCAAGAVFIAADPVVAATRYRNRSVQYLFMEAGAALHNGALSAHGLDLGFATIGGYYEGPIQQLCGLERQMVLGSAIFGSRPSGDDLARLSKTPDIEFAWVNTASTAFTAGFTLARARIKHPDANHPYTWGRSIDPGLAMRKAVAEAIEREGFREPRHVVTGTMEAIDGAIDPRSIVAYEERQYKRPDFPYRRFHPRDVHAWASGTELTTGKRVFVLADLVYSRTSLANAGIELGRPYSQSNSSGCAAGTSIEDASLRALLEVVERHAFMLHWLTQKPGRPVDVRHCDEATRSRIQALRQAGCMVSIQLLDTNLAHVALVAAQSRPHHFTTMGTAASFDAHLAIASALDELEARAFAWLNGHQPSIAHPKQVQTTEHHFELYGLPRYFRKADAVLFPSANEAVPRFPEPLTLDGQPGFVAHLSRQSGHPIVIDITPARHCIDQGRTPLAVVKAFVPGLLPMSFGYQTEPRLMCPQAHPASRFPHPFP